GEIETPGFADASAGPLDMNLFALSASANTEKKGKSQMAPLKQPDDTFVFSSFMRKDVMGDRWYYVTINFDPSH
ncbi:MAG TPA: hypothetical protein VNX47_13375, partial [Nevskia sp.]|nr:hypothetical protein [Nevskia sp.]